MPNEILPELPKSLERYIDRPYRGLFGKAIQAKVIEEIVADPYRNYRPKDLEELIEASSPSIRNALNRLVKLNILKKDLSDRQHPIYSPNLDSKTLVALTFLSYAVTDDRDSSHCMDDAIINYCTIVLKERFEPSAIATAVKYDYKGLTIVDTITRCIFAKEV